MLSQQAVFFLPSVSFLNPDTPGNKNGDPRECFLLLRRRVG